MNDQAIGFRKDKHRFLLKVAAIIIEENCLLMTRKPQTKEYVPIGGTVHLHESSKDALRRLVYEEIGIHYDVRRLVTIQERLYNEVDHEEQTLECHAITFYYLLKSKGQKDGHSLYYSQSRRWPLEWIPLDQIQKYSLEATFPLFWLKKPTQEVVHQVFDDRNKK